MYICDYIHTLCSTYIHTLRQPKKIVSILLSLPLLKHCFFLSSRYFATCFPYLQDKKGLHIIWFLELWISVRLLNVPYLSSFAFTFNAISLDYLATISLMSPFLIFQLQFPPLLSTFLTYKLSILFLFFHCLYLSIVFYPFLAPTLLVSLLIFLCYSSYSLVIQLLLVTPRNNSSTYAHLKSCNQRLRSTSRGTCAPMNCHLFTEEHSSFL